MTLKDVWEELYAAEWDVRFAEAHREVSRTMGVKDAVSDAKMESMRRRVAAAREAVVKAVQEVKS